MEVLVLGAGYGTRLQRDIEQDESGKYSGLIGCPKPLLPIGEGALLRSINFVKSTSWT